MKTPYLYHKFFVSAIILVAAITAGFRFEPLVGLRPSFALAALIVFAFFLNGWGLGALILFTVLVFNWQPGFGVELYALAGIPFAVFLLRKTIVPRAGLLTVLGAVVVGTAVFYVCAYGFSFLGAMREAVFAFHWNEGARIFLTDSMVSAASAGIVFYALYACYENTSNPFT